MNHNWRPGDVAYYDGHRVMLTDQPAGLTWVDDEGDACNITRLTWDWECRPLLVIDPEDRAQVMRLAEAWDAQTHATLEDGEPMSLSGWRMQAALRALLEPEPEEPTGLGAVVLAGGSAWVRIYQHHDDCKDWRRTDDEPGNSEEDARSRWSHLPRPLTVLSPGYVEGADS